VLEHTSAHFQFGSLPEHPPLSRDSRNSSAGQSKSQRASASAAAAAAAAADAETAGSRGVFKHPAAWGVLLGAMTFVVFAPSLRNDFVAFDDMAEIVARPDYNPPSLAKLAHYWKEPDTDLYTPVLWTVWGLLAFVARTRDASGVHWDAFPYHLFNVTAHVAAAVMAFLVLRRLVRSSRAAFLGAALFALHPIQVEAVAWVSGMKTPLSGFFALWSTWHYLRFSELRYDGPSDESPARRRSWIHYTVATIVFVLAMITKPTVVVLPLIVGVLEWLLRGRRLTQVIVPLAPWLALGALFAIINKTAQPAAMVFHPTLLQRVLIGLQSLSFYLWKLVLPYPLLPDYSHWPDRLVQSPWLWAGAAPAAVLLVAAAALARRAPWLAAGTVVFALGAATTIGLISYDYQLYSTVADRYAYLSVFGVALVVARLTRARPPATRQGRAAPRRKGVATAAVAVVLVVCAILSIVQCTLWANSDTLFKYTLQYNPDSLIAYRSFAFLASRHGTWNDVLAVANEGLAHRPGDPVLLQYVGNAALGQNRVDDAIAAFTAATKNDPRGADKLLGLGFALDKAGRTAEAEAIFKAATQAETRDKSDTASAFESLGILAVRRQSWDEAAGYFRQALALEPAMRRSREGLAFVLARAQSAAQSRPATQPESKSPAVR
jgi:tetratricopeptide (TPR) repeat protein